MAAPIDVQGWLRDAAAAAAAHPTAPRLGATAEVLASAAAAGNALDTLNLVASSAWDVLHAAHAERPTGALDAAWRTLHAAAAALAATAASLHADRDRSQLLKTLQLVDTALIIGTPEAQARLQPAADVLVAALRALPGVAKSDTAACTVPADEATATTREIGKDDTMKPLAKRPRLSGSSSLVPPPGPVATPRLVAVLEPLPRIPCPALTTFRASYMGACVKNSKRLPLGRPVVLAGVGSAWPALQRWSSASYWRDVAGERLVPIERGRHYMSPDWSTSLMPLGELASAVLGEEDGGAAGVYMAQHALLGQVPALASDVAPWPDYCALSEPRQETAEEEGDKEGLEEPLVQVWLGRDTVSCLHWDAPHNVLVQVVGSKTIRLFPPPPAASCFDPLSPPPPATATAGAHLPNTSWWDPTTTPAPSPQAEGDNDESTPSASPITGYVATLTPGDGLYIPPGWWHHVVSPGPCAAVSFWW